MGSEKRLRGVFKSPLALSTVLIGASFVVPTTHMLAVVGLAVWLIVLYAKSLNLTIQRDFFYEPEVLLIFGFCGYALISLSWSPHQPIYLAKEVIRIAIVTGIILLFGYISSDKKVLRADYFFISLLSLYGFFIIIDIFQISPADLPTYQIAVTHPGLFYHHSPIAWMYGMSILLAIPKILVTRKLKRMLLALSCLISLIVMLMCQSRGAYLGLFSGIAAFIFLNRRKLGKYAPILLIPVPITFFSLYYLGHFQIINSLVARSDAGRRYIYSNALNAISKAPIFGHGFGASPQNVLPDRFIAMHYHDIYLDILFYGGIVGLCIFMLMLFVFLIKNYRSNFTHGWYTTVIMAVVIFLFDGSHIVTYPSAELYILLLPILITVSIRFQLANFQIKQYQHSTKS